jgi:hypothetical protein
MNKYQKAAYFTLVLCGLALVLSISAMLILHFDVGKSWRASTAGFAFIGIIGFSGIHTSLFKKDLRGLDERDLLIKHKAMIAAMTPMFIYSPDGVVPVYYLFWMVLGGLYCAFLIYSIAILNEYGWSDKNE